MCMTVYLIPISKTDKNLMLNDVFMNMSFSKKNLKFAKKVLTNNYHCSIIVIVREKQKIKCEMRVCWNWQTGTFEGRVLHDVRVQVPSLAPSKVYKKDVTEKSPIISGFFAYFGNVFLTDFQRCQKGFFPQNRIRTFTKHIFTIF